VKTVAVGPDKLKALTGRLDFAGDARDTNGTAQIEAASSAHSFGAVSGLSLAAKFGLRSGDFNGRGTVKAARLVLDPRYSAQLRSLAGSTVGTPVGPLLQKLSEAGARGAQDMAVSADVAAQFGGSRASAIITAANVTTPQGARLHMGGGQGVGFGASGLFADSQATLAGGGFPTMSAAFRRTADGMTTGTADIAPYAAGAARLALSPVRFAVSPSGGARVAATASLDGPIGEGHVAGLQVPLTLTVKGSDIALNPGCTTAAFRALSVAGLRLDPTTLRLCATSGALFSIAGGQVDGGATVMAPRLTGRLGGTPVAIAAGRAKVALGSNRFAIGDLGVKIGGASRLTTLGLGLLEGAFVGGGVDGKFASLSGKIGNVPLLIDAGAGDWTLHGGILALTGAARVSDEAKPVRFNPLAADDVKLRLTGGKIMMTGMLREPKSRIAVSAVAIEHDLGSGNGHAALDVSSLNFGTALQPDTLTPLTLGVVANVAGSIAGKGRIDWSSAGVTSSGRFASKGLDFAAAFGPVTGVAGEIVFTDLLGLVTAPGQVASIATVNPGIVVPDGRVTYHLAPDQRIVVEGGRWPFAGGALILDPTTLDMGVTKERRLTFRIEGLDAAKFIQQLEFENLAATGLFDGAMPMIFDEKGGRIVGGKIVARPGGGTLSYVGDVSNAKLNAYAKLAFDALKAIRYNNLAIGMDGALDGEIISTVNFRGVNQAPATEKRGYFARQFSNLPFIFNITIRAPFRGLLNTARTYQDPSSLLSGLPNNPPAIQPPESGKRP
jgi:translocation and assembly module TamB